MSDNLGKFKVGENLSTQHARELSQIMLNVDVVTVNGVTLTNKIKQSFVGSTTGIIEVYLAIPETDIPYIESYEKNITHIQGTQPVRIILPNSSYIELNNIDTSVTFVWNYDTNLWRPTTNIPIIPIIENPQIVQPSGLVTGVSEKIVCVLSRNGKTLVIGNPGSDFLNTNGGAIWIYERNDTYSNFSDTPTMAYGTQQDELFGYSVDVSNNGEIVAVGAPGFSSNKGRSYVYRKVNGVWAGPENVHTVTGPPSGDQAGISVGISGDGSRVVTGSPYHDDGTNDGLVHVSKYDGTNWQTEVQVPKPAKSNLFGYDVAISENGKQIFVGSPEGGNTGKGKISVFDDISGDYNGAGAWEHKWSVQKNGPQNFGKTIAFVDNFIYVAGNPDFGGGGRVFVFDGNGTQIQQIQGFAGSISFGDSVSLSSDGSVLAIGDSGASSNAGRVVIYAKKSDAVGYDLVQTVNGTGTQKLGNDVDVNNGTLIITSSNDPNSPVQIYN